MDENEAWKFIKAVANGRVTDELVHEARKIVEQDWKDKFKRWQCCENCKYVRGHWEASYDYSTWIQTCAIKTYEHDRTAFRNGKCADYEPVFCLSCEHASFVEKDGMKCITCSHKITRPIMYALACKRFKLKYEAGRPWCLNCVHGVVKELGTGSVTGSGPKTVECTLGGKEHETCALVHRACNDYEPRLCKDCTHSEVLEGGTMVRCGIGRRLKAYRAEHALACGDFKEAKK